jgi:hypothetical protein
MRTNCVLREHDEGQCWRYMSSLCRGNLLLSTSAVEIDRPPLFDETAADIKLAGLDSPGRLVETEYVDLTPPIEKASLSENWLLPQLGPFYTGAWTAVRRWATSGR